MRIQVNKLQAFLLLVKASLSIHARSCFTSFPCETIQFVTYSHDQMSIIWYSKDRFCVVQLSFVSESTPDDCRALNQMNQVYIFAGLHEKMCSVWAIQGPKLNISVFRTKKKALDRHNFISQHGKRHWKWQKPAKHESLGSRHDLRKSVLR